MSKFLRRSVFALAFLCALGALSAARAQRVGPVEDERAATDAAKGAGEKADAKSADKNAPKTDAKKLTGDAKLDHTTTSPAPSAAPSSATPSSSAAAGTSTTTTNPVASPSSVPSSPPSHAAGSPSPTANPSSAVKPTPTAEPATALGEKAASTGAGDVKSDPAATAQAAPNANTLPSMGALPPPPKYEAPQPLKADVPASSQPANNSTNSASAAANAAANAALSSIYRVGAGDILDIRLVGGMSKDFTLFTVLANGTIDYPLAGEPVSVAGLTTEEIGARLSAALKRRGIFDRAQFQIAVRDYASHSVMVSGLVDQPGQKFLQREAVPLYVVFATASLRADAGRVVVASRATGRTRTLDLSDPATLNEFVSNGDVITVQPRPQEFFYIAGEINAAGQKDYHAGMTLTQAILAAGGVTRSAGKRTVVTVSRQGADGRLVPVDYVLQEIEDGKVPDPRIQPGDRIEVGRRR